MLYITFLLSLVGIIVVWLLTNKSHYFNFSFDRRITGGKIVKIKAFHWWFYLIILTKGLVNKPNWQRYPSIKEKLLLSVGPPLLKLLAIICCCSFVFSLTQIYIDTHTKLNLFPATILQIENTARKIDGYVKWLKPIFPFDLLISFLFVFLSGSFVTLKAVQQKYSKFGSYLSTTLLVFTIFTSFTFFGVRLEKMEKGREGKMRFHAAQIISDNELLLHQIREHQKEQTIKKVLSKSEVRRLIDRYRQSIQNWDSTKSFLNANHHLVKDSLQFNLRVKHLEQVIELAAKVQEKVSFAEVEFKSNYQESYKRDFYDDNRRYEFKQYYDQNKDWFDQNVSSASTKAARDEFETETKAEYADLPDWYEEYKDLFKTAWKGFYGETAKTITKPFIDIVSEHVPFFNELFDVLVHDPLEDAAFDKGCETYEAYQHKKNARKVDLGTISLASNEHLTEAANQSFANNSALSDELTKITTDGRLQITTDIDRNLRRLKAADPWNSFRENILADINRIACPYFEDKKDVFKTVLQEWDNYLEANKGRLYYNNVSNLETFSSIMLRVMMI